MNLPSDPHADAFREWLAGQQQAQVAGAVIEGAPQVGDRVMVIQTIASGGGYETGDTAAVTEVRPLDGVFVSWDERRHEDQEEDGRENFLLRSEFVIIERPARKAGAT